MQSVATIGLQCTQRHDDDDGGGGRKRNFKDLDVIFFGARSTCRLTMINHPYFAASTVFAGNVFHYFRWVCPKRWQRDLECDLRDGG